MTAGAITVDWTRVLREKKPSMVIRGFARQSRSVVSVEPPTYPLVTAFRDDVVDRWIGQNYNYRPDNPEVLDNLSFVLFQNAVQNLTTLRDEGLLKPREIQLFF